MTDSRAGKDVVGGKVGDGLKALSTFGAGTTRLEVLAIVATAVVVIGGLELALRWFEVPHYILPPPSAIAAALVKDFHLILPHLGYTLVVLLSGFAIGAGVGLK